MSNTPNYNLTTWSSSETSDSFNNFLFGVAGDTNSNMTKIDTQMKNSADGVLTLKNAPIKTIFANRVSDSYYTATVSDYSAYVAGNIFLLTLDTTCHDTLTININSIGTVSVMKYKSDGSIYNLSAGDIVANVPIIMTFDGTRWIILNDIKSGEISTDTYTAISGLLKGSSGKIAQAISGTDYMAMSGGNMTGAINEALVSSMAVSGTMNIGAAAGNYIIVTTGTGPITAFDVAPAGARRFMRFSVPTTINYNATTMLIPGSENLDVVSGDVLEWVSGGSGVWRCVNIERWNRIEPEACALKTSLVNPNELINWDFADPVSEDGVLTSGSPYSTAGYFWSVWRLMSGTITWTQGTGLALTTNTEIRLYREINYAGLLGKTRTVSVMLTDGTVKQATGAFPASVAGADVETTLTLTGFGTVKLGFKYVSGGVVIRGKTNNYVPYVSFIASDNLSVRRTKSEIGTISTLANDIEMDFDLALKNCRRLLTPMTDAGTLSRMWHYVTGLADFCANYEKMRIAPTATLHSGAFVLYANGSWGTYSATYDYSCPNNGLLIITATSASITSDQFMLGNGSPTPVVWLDARLIA